LKRVKQIFLVFILFLIPVLILFVHGCKDDSGGLDTFYEEEDLLISSYLREHEEAYSTLSTVLEMTGLEAILDAYGHYTFFAPDNDAFIQFCDKMGYSSVTEMDVGYLKILIKYHLLNKEIETSFMPNGVFEDTTYTGDNLVSSFSEGGITNIMINSESSIVESDIKVANGIIHRIDNVLKPVIKSMYEYLDELEEYEIFTEALRIAGLDDTLKTIKIFLDDEKFIRAQFTLLIESDDVFANQGIYSVGDLLDKYSDSDDPEDLQNGFYQFMAYHCITGLYYLNTLNPFNYPTLNNNTLINIEITDDIIINHQQINLEGQQVDWYIRIIRDESNRVVKNGVYHAIDKVLEPWEPEPVYFAFEFSDYQGINIGETYTPEDMELIDGINIDKTNVTYRYSVLEEDSAYLETSSVEIGWVVEFTIPPIIRGTYDVYLHWVSDKDRTSGVQIFWDGHRFNDSFSLKRKKRPPAHGDWVYDYRVEDYIGTVVLSDTETHNIKFLNLVSEWGGRGCFDYITFHPK